MILAPPKKRKKRRKKAKRRDRSRCKFEQTPVGYLIKHACPLEWSMIEKLQENGIRRITPNFLESLCYTSESLVFKTETYRKALIDYRKHGLSTRDKKEFDVEDELRFIKSKLGEGLEF